MTVHFLGSNCNCSRHRPRIRCAPIGGWPEAFNTCPYRLPYPGSLCRVDRRHSNRSYLALPIRVLTHVKAYFAPMIVTATQVVDGGFAPMAMQCSIIKSDARSPPRRSARHFSNA
jgi:hypothetical protein